MNRNRFSLLLPLALLGACGTQNAAEQEDLMPTARIPEQVCKQAADGVEQLKQSGGFVLNAPGEATLDEEAWMRMDERQRDQLVKLVAYDAACKAPEPVTEQSAIIRSEYGRVLTERVVETEANVSSLIGE